MGGKGGGSGGGSGDQTITTRYAKYIETRHSDFLNTVYSYRNNVINDSPFFDYNNIPVDIAFFGTGYLISSFPSLYDMYGKFMAGLDIEALWLQMFESTVNSSVVNDLISAQSAMMDDEIETTSIPRLQIGMRDVNAVMTSSFVIGKTIIETAKTKALSLFSSDLKYKMVALADSRWKAHLEWNKNVINMYAEIMKLYFSSKIDVDEVNYAMAAKDRLWPFTVLDFERAALGALQGATSSKSDVAGASSGQKLLGGALSGAAMGATIGGPVGAGVGGLLGIASSFL